MKHFDVALSRNLRFSRCRFPVFSRVECRPLDTVPLVDMALVFLLFIIMTSGVVRRPGLMIDLPVVEEPTAAVPYNHAVVSLVSADRIYLDEQRILPRDLTEGLRRLQMEYPGEALVVEMGGEAPAQMLTDLMREARMAGFERVLLATETRPRPKTEPVQP